MGEDLHFINYPELGLPVPSWEIPGDSGGSLGKLEFGGRD